MVHRVLLSLICCSPGLAQEPAASPGGWERLPLPSGDGRIESLRFEPGGSAWILRGGAPCYWDGRGFRAPRTAAPSLHEWMAGGFDRPLLVAERGRQNDGKLFRLVDGDCVFETAYHHDVPHEPPAIHVTREGQLFHWGNGFLAVRVDGSWDRTEAALDHRLTFVLETADRVWFYFNRHLYSVDPRGRITHRELPCPLTDERGGARLHAALWGDGRMLIAQLGSRELHAYELATGEPVPLDGLKTALGIARVHDVVRRDDGAVWLSIDDSAARRFVFWRLDPTGRVHVVEETSALWWRNLRYWSHPGSICNASDGSIWFGSRYQGVGRYRDGKIETFGWRAGLTGDIRFLAEGRGNTVYAASAGAVYAFHPDRDAAAPPRWVSQWTELPRSFAAPSRTATGDIFQVRHDRPNELFTWDGREFTGRSLPFEPRRKAHLVTDDQGHLMFAMNRYSGGCYDVGPGGVTRYRNLRRMLAAAVQRGARGFRTDRSLQGCVRTPDGQLWFGYRGDQSVHRFDGEWWTELQLEQPIAVLYESARHGVLVRTRRGGFHTYDRGQFVALPVRLDRPGRWLLGPRSFQPFEAELLMRRPDRWVVAERDAAGTFHLLVPTPRSENAGDEELAWRRAAPLPRRIAYVEPVRQGHWIRFPRKPLRRILGDSIVESQLNESPLADRANEIAEILEDRDGNVFFALKLASGYVQTFVKRVSPWQLGLGAPPKAAGSTVELHVTATLGGEPEPPHLLFWRLRGGTWRRADRADRVRIGFSHAGTFDVEVTAMDRIGAVAAPVRRRIEASFPVPRTHALRPSPIHSDDVVIELPFRAVPSGDDTAVRLAYRRPGEPWQLPYRKRFVTLFGHKPGDHEFEVAAFEGDLDDGVWDPEPKTFTVRFRPKVAAMVERRLARLDDADEYPFVVEELQRIGRWAIPDLERHLAATTDPRRAAVLQSLIDLIERTSR